ncbi:MAG: type I phosphomannose isomerase catalytic subunit [Isosphaeraceae bacterium]
MEPLVFEPYLRPMVWGGRGLAELFSKRLPDEGTYGEAWEISAHPLHISRVAEGPHKGQTLTDLAASHPEDFYGSRVPADGAFPLLFKLLDCHQLLSIQVHPNDEQARRLTEGREHFGKTEAWVVLAVEPGGKIYAGLRPGVRRADLERHLTSGTLESCLHVVDPRPGDCIFLPAGTVHAVGGGVVMAEVQQSSDATFRLYDWNRPGPDGNPRPLHIRESLESINWSAGPVSPAMGRPLSALPEGVFGERLVTCDIFHLDRYHAGSSFAWQPPDRLSIWLVVDGRARLSAESGYQRTFERGETVLIPATAGSLRWEPLDEHGHGPTTLLAVTIP